MTGLVQTVRDKLDDQCLTGRLNKDGCRIPMTGAPDPHLVVDFDKPGSPLGSNQTRCDYLFIAEGNEGSGWVVLLELKKGRLHADEVVRQLKAGARVAERLAPSDNQVRFRPVAVAGNAPKAERNRLKAKKGRIQFHGCAETVRLISCGDALTKALRP